MPKAKGQLTKANQTKAKMENLARELQKVTLYSPSQEIADNVCRITSGSGCVAIPVTPSRRLTII